MKRLSFGLLVAVAALAAACSGSDSAAVPTSTSTPGLDPTATMQPAASPTSTATSVPDATDTPESTAATSAPDPTHTPEPTPALPLTATPVPMPTPTAMPVPTPGQAASPLQRMRVVPAFPNLEFQELTNLVEPEDGRGLLYVTEKPGRIRVFPNDQEASNAEIFLDITDRVRERNKEEGLLGLAFDPEFANNGYLYVYYSASGPRRSVVSRFSRNPDDPRIADPQSEFVIMEVPQPFGNHNGGQIAFGPDGFLYIGLGDGGSGGDPLGNGQNRDALLGSILRIDVGGQSQGRNYRVPSDNPFVGVDDAREEIWAYGLRNPWRFSFDTTTGQLWVADVGQNEWEEVDIIERGGNYGWSVMEGAHCFSPSSGCDRSGIQLPVTEYSHAEGCSITGGYVFRGPATPSLLGAYVYADFCSGNIWAVRHDGTSVTEQMLLVTGGLSISSFGQDLDGNLYILDFGGGIFSLVPRG